MDRVRLPRVAWALLALLTIWAVPSAARACSCKRPPPPLAAADAADVVFEGVAGPPRNEGMRTRTNFRVLRTFKGDTGAVVDVLTMSSSAACGRRYIPGEKYLVYASQSTAGLSDNLCSRTRRSLEAGTDFAVLGRGVGPSTEPEEIDDGPNVEPPRIAPAAETPPPVQARRRGCSALPHAGGGLLASVLLLLAVASLSRRRLP